MLIMVLFVFVTMLIMVMFLILLVYESGVNKPSLPTDNSVDNLWNGERYLAPSSECCS